MEILHTLKQQGYTIIISEHRIHYLKDIADRAVLIEYGQITRELDASAFRSLSNEEANRMGLRSTDLLSIRPPVTQKKPERRNKFVWKIYPTAIPEKVRRWQM